MKNPIVKSISYLLCLFVLGCAASQQGGEKSDKTALKEKQPQLTKAQTAYSFGYEYLKNRMYDEAIKSFESAIQDSHVYVDAYINLSLAYKGKLMYDKMKETYNRLEKIAPLKAYYALGSLYTELGQFDSAIVQHNKALAMDSAYVDALYGLGYAHEKKNDMVTAIKHYENALRHNPKNESVRYSLAKAYISQGRNEEGIRELRDLVNSHPDDMVARTTLGRALLTNKKYTEAKAEFEYIAKTSPDNIENKINLGRAYEGLKDNATALQLYKEAINTDTTNIYSYLPIIDLLRAINVNEAMQYLQRAKNISPDNQVLHCLGGDIFFESAVNAFNKKNFDATINNYRSAINEYKLALKGEVPEWQEYAKKAIQRVEVKLKEAEQEKWWHH